MICLILCRIDSQFVIKITDFGLSEDIFLRNYFREGLTGDGAKLPVKWMAPESLSDGHFSEKSDVVCEIGYIRLTHCTYRVYYFTVVIWCDNVGGIQWW